MTIEDFASLQDIDLGDLIGLLFSQTGLVVSPDTHFEDISVHYYGRIGIIAWALKKD
ncbi:hypothetical protein [Tolypothrix sp. VBCCA 56010]|uniref:hypothetical protein n=1 Tax=Tolypothrix sp. VBCCA 56010 TaxID=3137731 RepID=UPI003D7C9842